MDATPTNKILPLFHKEIIWQGSSCSTSNTPVLASSLPVFHLAAHSNTPFTHQHSHRPRFGQSLPMHILTANYPCIRPLYASKLCRPAVSLLGIMSPPVCFSSLKQLSNGCGCNSRPLPEEHTAEVNRRLELPLMMRCLSKLLLRCVLRRTACLTRCKLA